MTVLARCITNYKRQTRPLVREDAPHQQTRNCLRAIKSWSRASDGCLTPRQTGRLTVGRNATDFFIFFEREREGTLHNIYDSKGSVAKDNLWSWSLKVLGTKRNWLAVNRQSWSNSDCDCDWKQEKAMHRNYKRLKLGGGQAYDHSPH
jgi:hypothetical protein